MGKLLGISLKCYKKFKGYRKEFFNFFLQYIEPEKIEIKAPFTNRKYKNFYSTKEKFFELISKKEYEEEYIEIMIKQEKFIKLSLSSKGFYIVMNKNKYLDNSDEIDNHILELFVKMKGCIAKIEDWDYSNIQNEKIIDFLELEGIQVPEEKIKIYRDGRKEVDITKNPGYTREEHYVPFGVYWKMWIANDYYNWLSKEKLASYTNCYRNIELEDGVREIIMTKTLEEFISEETDNLKWDFREKIGIEEAADKLKAIPYEMDPDYADMEYIYPENRKDVRYDIIYFDNKMESIARKYATKYVLTEIELDENGKFVREKTTVKGKIENLDKEKLKEGKIELKKRK